MTSGKKKAQRQRVVRALLREEYNYECRCIVLNSGYPMGLNAAGIVAETSTVKDDEKRINDLLEQGHRLVRELAVGNKVMLFFEREVK